MDINRILSLIIALGYLIAAFFSTDAGDVILVLAGLILALGLIWFGDELGSYIGISGSGIGITRTSPGCFITFLGWLLLLAPLIILLT